MSLKKWFVSCYIFDSNDVIFLNIYNFVDQQKWESVRKQFFDFIYIHNHRRILIVNRCPFSGLFLLNGLFEHPGKFRIGTMTRFRGYDATFNSFPSQCQIANYIEQLMTGTLVIVLKFNIIQYSV